MKVCGVCGKVAAGNRCAVHARKTTPGRNHGVHTDPRWARLSKRLIARHVGQYGWVCPGDGVRHASHPTTNLTVDHIVPLSEGGAAFDTSNLRVLCRHWNSVIGGRIGGLRVHQRATDAVETAPLDERAVIRARYL